MENSVDTVDVPTSVSLAVDQLERSYDAEVKNFLKEKQILAIILKSCVSEFKDCSAEDIAQKYIEGTPLISDTAVDQDAEPLAAVRRSTGSKIAGDSNEDKSRNEGLVTYDIRFTAVAPKTNELIKLIINVEAQRQTRGQKYPIIKRGHYYCARLLSAQKDVEFKGTHYEDIKKVYSIWICQNVPKDREHSVVIYRTVEEVASSLYEVKPYSRDVYENMTVVVISLGDTPVENTDEVVRMLTTALSDEIDVNTKKRSLAEDFGIKMTEPIERSVDRMCNLSYGIAEKAEARGEARGVAVGEARGEARGVAIGEARGKLIQLYELVWNGDLPLNVGARKAEQPEEEFKAGMEAYYAQRALS